MVLTRNDIGNFLISRTSHAHMYEDLWRINHFVVRFYIIRVTMAKLHE